MPPLNLNALDNMRHVVEFDGVTYSVKAITARIAGLVTFAAATEGLARIASSADVVAALVPDMPRAIVDNLTVPQLAAIVELAGTEVRAVEEAMTDPKAESPASASGNQTAISSAASS